MQEHTALGTKAAQCFNIKLYVVQYHIHRILYDVIGTSSMGIKL